MRKLISVILGLAPALIIIAASYAPAQEGDFIKSHMDGMFAFSVNKYDDAIAHFTDAIKKNPKFIDSYQKRAVAYSKMGKYDACVKDLKTVIKLEPNPDAFLLLGLVYEIKKDYPSAVATYRQGMKVTKIPEHRQMLKRLIAEADKKTKK